MYNGMEILFLKYKKVVHVNDLIKHSTIISAVQRLTDPVTSVTCSFSLDNEIVILFVCLFVWV